MHDRRPRGRHLGRHRVPTPPRTRYVAVVGAAVVGAGVVALSTASTMPDQKPGSDPAALQAIDPAYTTADTAGATDYDERQERADRSSRSGRTQELPPGNPQEAPDIWVLPVHDYDMTSDYGMRDGTMHYGLDFAAPIGTPIYAANAGTVIIAGYESSYGYLVKIDNGEGVVTYYAHNSELLVEPGDVVEAGDQIALMGSTGWSTGPHLHFEVRVDGEHVDPEEFLLAQGVDPRAQADEVYNNDGSRGD